MRVITSSSTAEQTNGERNKLTLACGVSADKKWELSFSGVSTSELDDQARGSMMRVDLLSAFRRMSRNHFHQIKKAVVTRRPHRAKINNLRLCKLWASGVTWRGKVVVRFMVKFFSPVLSLLLGLTEALGQCDNSRRAFGLIVFVCSMAGVFAVLAKLIMSFRIALAKFAIVGDKMFRVIK